MVVKYLLSIWLLLMASVASASVTITINVSALTTDPNAYVVIDLQNCPSPTLLNTSTVPLTTMNAYPVFGTATVTIPDNVSQIVCSGVQLSYYTFSLYSNGIKTIIKNAELPSGSFNLANLQNLAVAPFSAGVIAGPQGIPGTVTAAGSLNLTGTQATCNVGLFGQNNNCENIAITSSSQPLISFVRDRFVNMSLFGPGLNEGTASDTGHWNLGKITESQLTSGVAGIKQGHTVVMNCNSIGDCAANYVYLSHDGGVSGKGDEADEGYAALVAERSKYFHGTWAGGTSTSPLLTWTSGSTHTTAGGILLNMSRGSYSASLTANGTNFGYLVSLPTTSTTLPVSSAWGTVAAPITKANTTMDQYVSVSGIVVTLGQIGASYPIFHVGDEIWVSGPNFPEHTTITAASAVSGSGAAQTQTLTIPLRHYEGAGAMIFAGGLVGYYIDATANYNLSGMRTTYYAFGSLDGINLIAGKQVGGVVKNILPQYQAEAWTTSGANAAFVLRPGAEITANLNDAFTTPMGQSAPPNPIVTLEHNTANFTVGDLVEGPHYMTVGGSLAFWNQTVNSPTDISFGGSMLNMGAHGSGISGRYTLINGYNDVPATSYTSNGGPLSPATFMAQGGIWGDFASLDTEPKQPNYSANYSGDAMGAVVRIHNATNQFYLFRLPMAGSQNQRGMSYNPATGVFSIDNLTVGSLVGGTTENATTSVNTTLSPTAALNTVALASNYTFTIAAGVAGAQTCLLFVQGATAYTVTPPANVVGFFTVGTTVNKRSQQCFIYSANQTAWIPTGTGIVNF